MVAAGQYSPPPSHSPVQVALVSWLVLPKWPAAHWYGQPVKFIGGRIRGDGETHQPSGQWMVVAAARSSMLPDGHEDSDEATEMFRRVSVPLL